MRIAVTALGVALMIVSVMPVQIGAQVLDPQSLIGEWTGKWAQPLVGGTLRPKGSRDGAYRLIIKKIEGQAVSANIYIEDGGKKASEREVRGTLEGNTLTFGPTRFTVTGKDMQGNRGGSFPVEITLSKGK
jgi:hypothetical protein